MMMNIEDFHGPPDRFRIIHETPYDCVVNSDILILMISLALLGNCNMLTAIVFLSRNFPGFPEFFGTRIA
jgi:hypothetical protein